MRDEEEIEAMASKASSILSSGPHKDGSVEFEGKVYDVEHLRGIVDALDWVTNEGLDDPL
jgi:hypothetical protein